MTEDDPHAERRRRLIWRAGHRGTREMDILLGGFACGTVALMDEAALAELEAIVELPDPALADWLIHRQPLPAEHRSTTFSALLAFRP